MVQVCKMSRDSLSVRSAMTWVVVVYCGYATEWNIILMGLLARRPATGSFGMVF